MYFKTLHDWRVTPREAVDIQRALAGRVCTSGEVSGPGFIAGVDVSVNRFEKLGTAAVVVLVILLLIGIVVMARKWVWRRPR